MEPWADANLPVTDGLELWLDANRIEAAHTPRKAPERRRPPAGGKLATWFDNASGKSRNLSQSLAASRPTLTMVGDASIVRFDGEDDHLRLTEGKGELKAFTVFIVAAPRGEPR